MYLAVTINDSSCDVKIRKCVELGIACLLFVCAWLAFSENQNYVYERVVSRVLDLWLVASSNSRYNLACQPFYVKQEVVEHVMVSNHASYEKGKALKDLFQDVLGNGIFNADGDDWRVQRQLVHSAFANGALRKHMYSTFVVHALAAREVLKELCDTGESVDIQKVMERYALQLLFVLGVKSVPVNISRKCTVVISRWYRISLQIFAICDHSARLKSVFDDPHIAWQYTLCLPLPVCWFATYCRLDCAAFGAWPVKRRRVQICSFAESETVQSLSGLLP